LIEINEINKIYGHGKIAVNALKEVSLTVEKGEFVSIMGASGSGKSTLLNILGCLDRPSNGTYSLDGVQVSSLSDVELAKIRNQKIGFVFQSFNLLPRFSALHNVELPMIYAGVHHKERRAKAIEALDKVGLLDRMDHKPNEMSGGQKQRVAIARALVNSPAIILADEPTGNLDSTSSEEILAIFQGLNKEGVTVVLVTHEQEIAEHTKRVLRFSDGYLTSDEKINNPLLAKMKKIEE
jgi:putative ABC transport system ATP-binding protein